MGQLRNRKMLKVDAMNNPIFLALVAIALVYAISFAIATLALMITKIISATSQPRAAGVSAATLAPIFALD